MNTLILLLTPLTHPDAISWWDGLETGSDPVWTPYLDWGVGGELAYKQLRYLRWSDTSFGLVGGPQLVPNGMMDTMQ